MPVELLSHLRLLKHSVRSMRLGPPVPVLSRVYPFKLALAPRLCNQLRVRRFTNRPFRPRAGASSEFSRGGRDRGEEVRASKSLIDDETELSDWVSELGKTGSFRARVASDDGDDVADRGRDRRKSRDRGGDRNRDSFAMKRRRESDSDDFRQPSRGRSRNPYEFKNRDPSATKMRGKSEFDNRIRGTSGNTFESRNSFERTSRGMGSRQRKFKQSSDDDDDIDHGNDDEQLQSLRVGFQDLLSEDSDEGSDDGDDDVLEKSRGPLFGMDKEGSHNGRPSSPGKSGSYLSETR